MNIIHDPQIQSSYDDSANGHIQSVDSASIGSPDYNQRIYPRQVSTGSLRGTQTVGYGDVKIDGSNNRLVIGTNKDSQGRNQQTVLGQLNTSNLADKSFGLKIVNTDGAQILVGILPDGFLGIQLLDASGKEVMRSGYLPVTKLYGWAAATPGNDLAGQV